MNEYDINLFIDKLKKKHFNYNLFLFVSGMSIMALAFNLFFDRYNVIPTGSNGLAVIISEFIPLNISLLIFIVGLACLLLGLIAFGYKYAIKMILITVFYPFFVSSITYIANLIDFEDTSLFLLMFVGGGLMGFGNGLIRKSGYSTGGFCVVSDLLYKYFHMSIGTATLVVNAILLTISGFIYGLNSALYACVALIVSSYMIDRVIIGISNNKVFYIITEKPLEVIEYINYKLHYDLTIVNARGGYENKKKKMLMTVVSTFDYIVLKELVKEIDSKSFFLIVDVYDSNVKKKM